MFRFEYFENVISKHHLNNINWQAAAGQSVTNMKFKTGWFGSGQMTICNVRMVDEDTLEIIKRRNNKIPMFFKCGID